MSATPEPRLIAYIDESGCSGSKYGKGSSQFLAVGAVVFPIAAENDILSIFGAARAERKRQRQFNKFSENNDKDNFVLTRLLSQQKAVIVQVAMHKPSMGGSYIRSNHQKEYHYLVKFALERISWIARDAARGGDPSKNQISLVFSEQKMYPYEELASYLTRLKSRNGEYNCSVEWDFIYTTFTSKKHLNETGLNLADIVASALHKAVEPKQHGITDDRFQRNLIPLLYRRNSKAFGLKMFPAKEINQMRMDGMFAFLKLYTLDWLGRPQRSTLAGALHRATNARRGSLALAPWTRRV